MVAIACTDTTRDYEYTDWDDLRAFAREFSRTLAPTRDHVEHVAAQVV